MNGVEPGGAGSRAGALVAAAVMVAAAWAQAAPPPSAAERIDALLARYEALGQFNGTALVAFDGRVVLSRGYGKASVELGVPNTPATKMWIGSVSKVFTATAVMRLVDQGRLGLDDRLSDRLPWYRSDTGRRITIRQLLGHTSGVPDYMHLPGVGREGFRREAGDGVIDVKAFVTRWCSGDLQWEPGTRWGYSNSGYVLLGAVIEAVTGQPFEAALRALVLEPAGLAETEDLAMRPRAVVPKLASGYEKQAGALVTRRPWNVSTAYAAGAMVATVEDLYRFDAALDRPGFLSEESRRAMFTEGPGHYGCGWEVHTEPIGPGGAPRTVAGHEGFIYWAITLIERIPEDRAFVALANNTGDAPVRALFAGITDILYGREPAWPLPSAAEAVHAVAAERGGEAAVALYRKLLAESPGGYVFDERGLNALGYALLGEGRPDAAVAVLRLMTELHAGSANGFDSLGEALAAAGRREEAIRAYARSLELDPGNANAVERLGGLVKAR